MVPEPGFFPGDTSFNNTIRSQMWVDNGVWWGALSDASSGVYFYKLVDGEFIKGDLINDNPDARPDVLFNGRRLFILMHDSDPPETPSLGRLYKYNFARTTQRYALLRGSPVDLPLTGDVFDIAFDQDSTRKLWATYTDTLEGNVHVIWSTSNHRNWDTQGTVLASGLAVDTEEAATIVSFNDGQQHRRAVGVVWSNQSVGEIGFRFHLDENAEDEWSRQETVDCCEGSPGGVADDHLSLKATSPGRLFLIAKDDLGAEGRLHLYIRSREGEWGQKTLVDPDPNAAPTRPALVFDLEHREAYVIYRDSGVKGGGRLFFVRTSLQTGEEDPVFSPPCLFIDLEVNSPTSTKRAIQGRPIVAASGDDQIFWTRIPSPEESELSAESEFFPEPERSPFPEHEAQAWQAQAASQTPSQQSLEPPAQYGSIWEGRLSHSQTPGTEAQWRWLRSQGVRNIAVLDTERVHLGGRVEGFLWLPLASGEPPTDAEAEKFLKYIQTSALGHVHMLTTGSYDRVAVMRALISYAIDGRSVEAALAEARSLNGGDELSSAQEEWLRGWAARNAPASHRRT